MRYEPHQITKEFEKALCEYTGAKYAVAVNSCTMALLLSAAWHLRPGPLLTIDEYGSPTLLRDPVEIPKRTYCSVPMSIIHAGGRPTFRDEEWIGSYQLKPLPVWDSARYFTSGMYRGSYDLGNSHFVERDCSGQFLCVSFHWTKILGTEFRQGGAILHDNDEADAWFRRARFDGRTEGVAPKDDKFEMIGWHCYMDPTTAEALLNTLKTLPQHNEPLQNSDYPDLSKYEVFG
jgi:dTDP-4-amino-4,6-dideoxygalactose transaminase